VSGGEVAGVEAGGESVELNATAASLLGFLHDGPATGWDLLVRAEQTIGAFWSLTRSQVYRELTAMAGQGLVTAGETGKRDARPYTLTDRGRAAFAAWAARGPGEGSVRLPLLLFVTLGRHLEPGLLRRVLREQRARQAALLAEYTALRRMLNADEHSGDAADPHLLATLEYGITVARATVRWIDRLPPDIGTETVGGHP
jgi:DNA-binding PadR family transcriptional regulator